MIAETVGVIDRLGYLYCVGCAETLDVTGDPVAGDVGPHNVEPCDRCGRPLTGRMAHCTPAWGGHSLMCFRDATYCSQIPTHDGLCTPHGRPR